MNSRHRQFWSVIFLTTLMFFPIALYFTSGSEKRSSFPIGGRLPGIVLRSADGSSISTDSLTHRRSLIVVFSTHCDHCVELIKKIDTMYSELQREGEVIPVSLDDIAELRQFAERFQLSMHFFTDTEKQSLPFWNVRTIPTMIVLSEHRRVMNVRHGNISREELRQLMAVDSVRHAANGAER